ncbi:hypothetical protein [Mesorhizobium sp. M0058]|uniref:hypothetical protein n=1 Tax=Mesorhizobium sp. M0058 TaxID=2956865 RepID=UPI003339AD30
MRRIKQKYSLLKAAKKGVAYRLAYNSVFALLKWFNPVSRFSWTRYPANRVVGARSSRGLDPVMQYQLLRVFNFQLFLLLILAGVVQASRAAENTVQIKLDDIEIFYHGLALDDARRPINITRDDLPRLYLELARRALAANPPESAVSQAVRANQLLNAVLESSPTTDAVTSSISKLDYLSDILIYENKGSPLFVREYERYLGILRSLAGSNKFKEPPHLESELRPFLDGYLTRNDEGYKSCSDPSVPGPPDYGSALWNEKMDLDPKDGFLQQLQGKDTFYYPTKILFFNPKAPNPPGLCALLKRYKVTTKSKKVKELQIVAVICESYETGKSCFWEKPLVNDSGKKIEEKDLENPVNFGISSTWPNSNGGIKRDPCTACHIGNNSFIFYQGSDLCYNQKFHPGKSVAGDSPCFGKENQWSAPVGSLLLPGAKMDVGDDQNRCMTCHELAASAYDDWYCRLLKYVTGSHMPPNGAKEGLSWDGPSPGNKYEGSVAEIREFCQKQ